MAKETGRYQLITTGNHYDSKENVGENPAKDLNLTALVVTYEPANIEFVLARIKDTIQALDASDANLISVNMIFVPFKGKAN